MIADSDTPKQMPPNLGPGYRPPFNSETGRINGLKGARVMKEKALARKLQREQHVVIEVLKQVKLLLDKRSKRGSKPHLSGNHVVTTVHSKPDPKSPTIRPRLAKQSASQVKSEAIPTPKASSQGS